MPTPSAAPVVRRLLGLLLIGGGLLSGTPASAASPRSIDFIYEPFRVEKAALAPDGRHVAFIVRGDRRLEIQIFSTDQPGEKTTVALDRNRTASARLLHWISADQLVAVTDTPWIVVTDPTGRTAHPIDLTNLFRQSSGDQSTLVRPDARISLAPDDPACLLIESNIPVPVDDGDPDAGVPASAGIPGRPRLIEVHRLNILTGAVTRLLDYDVEKETPPGATIVDRTGKPRLVYRYGAEPPHFAYRLDLATTPTRRFMSRLFPDAGWRELDRVLNDRANFSFFFEAKTLLTERTIPLGFDSDPNILFFASNLRRDTFGIYAADLRTGTRTTFSFEEPGIDLVDPESPWTNPPLIFDPHTGKLAGVSVRAIEPHIRWFDPELETLQRDLEKKFPARRVQLLEWDVGRERALALVGSLGDPGRYFVYQRSDGRCVEYLRRAPALPTKEINPTESFSIPTAGSANITGYITVPRTPGKVLPPVVVALHGGPWQRLDAGYDRDAQALAAMGFAVVKINYRGSSGFGIAYRESIRASLDRGPIEDVLATLSWLRTRYHVDLRRVGLLGEGYGGYLALRALELYPESFQSAVSINGLTTPLDLWRGLEPEIEPLPFNPDDPPPKAEFKAPGVRSGADPTRALAIWLAARQPGLGGISVTSDLKLLTKPVFLLHDPASLEAPYLAIANLRASLRRQGRAPDLVKLTAEFARPDSRERARVVQSIGEFFNLTLYDFKVKIGEATEKADNP